MHEHVVATYYSPLKNSTRTVQLTLFFFNRKFLQRFLPPRYSKVTLLNTHARSCSEVCLSSTFMYVGEGALILAQRPPHDLEVLFLEYPTQLSGFIRVSELPTHNQAERKLGYT